ncbi:MAG: amino acid carrier protein [Clostridia bacterium]|nr:amino acid carrier protein [Clostridia bacterium]
MQVLTGVILPLLLLAAGAWFAVTVGRRLIRHPRRCLAAMGGKEKGSALRALSVALAGTLGVGNIAGVATAIVLGGAGAIFWMWISACLAMFLKYAEIVLAMRYRQLDASGNPHGGAMYYIKVALGGRGGKVLAAVFAILCFCCSVTLGGVIQSSAAAEAMAVAFDLPPLLIGGVMGVLAAVILARGSERIEQACAALVPFVCLLFSIAAVAVLILRREALPAAFAAIFKGAWNWNSCGAGALGFFTSRALRYGVARGLVSNEAGCGTAPIAHAAAKAKSPAAQGLWGIFEVFIDTVLLCTMTALVILTSGVPLVGEGGTALAIAAFSAVLGPVASPVLALSVLFFAFATVLCWSHYGAECLLYLTGKAQTVKWMLLTVLLSCTVGAVAAPGILWELTDVIIALMALLNITALLLLRRTVAEETKHL